MIVAGHPKALVRGLIHSDGNRHVNEVIRKLRSGPRRYRYPRYMFTNASTDILAIFTDALDLLEIHWTQTTARDISVARREDVAYMDTFIGPKRLTGKMWSSPECWNWYTRWSQTPLGETPCGFESRLRHGITTPGRTGSFGTAYHLSLTGTHRHRLPRLDPAPE